VSRRCHPSRPPIPEEREVNRLHAEVVKKRKEVAEAAANRKRKRKERHDKACKIARAEGKPRPATPESMSEEEEAASDAEAHLLSGGEAVIGVDSPPVYQEAGDEDAPAKPREARPGTEVAHASSGAKVAHTGGGRKIIHARDRAEVAPANDGRGVPRAHDVNGRRWVRGKRGGARADSLEASGCSEGDTLGSVVEGRWCSAGPNERYGQTQHECLVRVSTFGFVCCVHLIAPPILLTSVFLPQFPAPGPYPGTPPRSRRPKPSRPGRAPRRTRRRSPRPLSISWRRPRSCGR